jgi:uncharacterized protein
MLEELLNTVKKLNPWFRSGLVPDRQLKPFYRREFGMLKDSLSDVSFATLLVGGRRVGKSVLMYQLIDHLLKSGIDKKRILFIQGDNTILRECESTGLILNQILNAYEQYILDEDFSESKDTIYVFIDEAQMLPKWDTEVKTIIDLKYPIKFFITGSSSNKLRKGAETPLVGRVKLFTLMPFSFNDFARYEIELNKKSGFSDNFDALADSFRNGFLEGDLNKIYESTENAIKLAEKYKLESKFEDYIYFGGFPYVVENKETEDISKYLRDILSMTFFRDILTQDEVSIKEPFAFERLMVNICMNISQRFSLKALAEKIGVKDERTVRDI